MATSPFNTRPSLPFDLHGLGPAWRVSDTSSSEISSSIAKFTECVERSPNDKREYGLIRLENGLECLLISDPTLDKAAASLSVGVGHLNDPDALPGLAHFLEHMLFLGTEKFPDEAAYKTFLSQNSGSSNAFTSLDETNYHFSVHPTAIAGALERHSQFFVAPLFLASCTERELNAVDSEFRRNLMLDSRRLFQLGKATSSRENGAKYWKFGTGSKQTLWEEPTAKGMDVREQLLSWYSANYSANLMKLSIISTQSLEELTNLAVKHYSSIPNSNLTPPLFDAPVLTARELQKLVSYRTIKDTSQLRLEFPVPDQRGVWRSQPARYLSHQVGHEGPGSILSLLKAKGLATSLSSSASGGAPGFEFFRVSVDLTPLGLERYQEVLQIIFAYLDLARNATPQKWAFDESKTLGEISWQWKENGQPESTVTDLSSDLHSLYARDKVLVAPYFSTDFQPDLIRKFAANLTPNNCRVLLGSKNPLSGVVWDSTEKYYSTEYAVNPLKVDSAEIPSLALPLPNPFVPYNLSLVPKKDSTKKRPLLLRSSPSSRLFFKQDDLWYIPRARVHFLLSSPLASDSPLSAIKTQVLAELVEEELAEQTYDASLAGLNFTLGSVPRGLTITIAGYSEKIPLLLSIILEKLCNLSVDETMFTLVKDRLTRGYSNAKYDNPSSTASRNLGHVTRQSDWTYEERLQALSDLKSSDLAPHSKGLRGTANVDVLVHGNFTKADAIDILEMAEHKLMPIPSDPGSHDFLRGLVLPHGSNTVYRPPVFSDDNVNSAAIVFYQVGTCNTEYDLLVRLRLFAQIAKVPVFSTLRTKEQLGYIVQSGVRFSRGVAGFQVIVQSERTGEYLEDRIEALLSDSFGDLIENMSDEDFSQQRLSLVNQRLETPKNLGQESSRYWDQIESGELDFYCRERDADLIKQLTKQDLKDFWSTYIRSSSTRTKLSILMRSQRFQPASLQSLSDVLKDDVAVDFGELSKTKPTLSAITNFLEKVFPNGVSAGVQKEVDALTKLPALQEGVVEVTDIEEFRGGLERAPRVLPVDNFEGDLSPHL